jgi:hypothetical protein
VHQRFNVKRLVMALIAYVALAVLTCLTIEDEQIRAITVALLVMFAVKSWLRRKDVMHPDGESGAE